MSWNYQTAVLAVALLEGFILSRILIPFFRKIKTGKFEFYIGDRFKKDGSEPKFSGVIIFTGCFSAAALGFSLVDEAEFKLMLCAAFLCLMLLMLGVYEDYVRETKISIGLNSSVRIICEYLICVQFLIILQMFGIDAGEILLPFRLGYIDLGWGYVPLTALVMTLVINLTGVHDCPFGAADKAVDGLCLCSTIMSSLGLTVCCAVMQGHSESQILALSTAGVCGGLLIWHIYPSKIYLGQSGSLVLGGLLSCQIILSKMHIAVITALLPMVADGLCAAVQRIVYKFTKKLVFKGNSLHEHLKNIGWGEYKIIAAFECLAAVGIVLSALMGCYAQKIIL